MRSERRLFSAIRSTITLFCAFCISETPANSRVSQAMRQNSLRPAMGSGASERGVVGAALLRRERALPGEILAVGHRRDAGEIEAALRRGGAALAGRRGSLSASEPSRPGKAIDDLRRRLPRLQGARHDIVLIKRDDAHALARIVVAGGSQLGIAVLHEPIIGEREIRRARGKGAGIV